MNLLGKSLIVGILMSCSTAALTQIVLSTETFGTGSAAGTSANGFVGDMGTWTVTNTGVNGASCNNWYVSGEECGNAAGSCGSVCSGGDNSLHISAIGGLCASPDCGAAYDESGLANQTNQRAESPTIDCSNHYFIELNFNYIAAQGDDGFWVEYSTNNGTTWSTFTGGNVAATQCCGCNDAFLCGCCLICCGGITACSGLDQGLWTAINLSFPVAADNNNQVKFAFHWSNNGNGIGTDPSVAIDDITVTYATSLAIELVSFQVENTDHGNLIEWATASEEGLKHYDIQYSSDGALFHSIGRKSKKMPKESSFKYQFLHQSNLEHNYYRLRMEDENGEYEYSETIYIKNDLAQIYYTINQGIISIMGLEKLQGEITTFDLSGKQINGPIIFDKESSQVYINIQELNTGIYFIKVKTPLGAKNFKILR